MGERAPSVPALTCVDGDGSVRPRHSVQLPVERCGGLPSTYRSGLFYFRGAAITSEAGEPACEAGEGWARLFRTRGTTLAAARSLTNATRRPFRGRNHEPHPCPHCNYSPNKTFGLLTIAAGASRSSTGTAAGTLILTTFSSTTPSSIAPSQRSDGSRVASTGCAFRSRPSPAAIDEFGRSILALRVGQKAPDAGCQGCRLTA